MGIGCFSTFNTDTLLYFQLIHGFRLMSHCVQQRQGLNQIQRQIGRSETFKVKFSYVSTGPNMAFFFFQ